jgi:F-type H+-transporting ATPase subunit alpha
MPELLAEFKKGNLPEDGINKMLELVNGMIPQFSK